MTDPLATLFASLAADLSCDVNELRSRLTGPVFVGHELLPQEIIDAWDDLSLDAKAIAVLFAKAIDDENELRWDRHERG